ncbi:hypothetical protein A2U01_0016832, partial [Trifolium medium]|nr:hypothetical protein [Trifolium medium]
GYLKLSLTEWRAARKGLTARGTKAQQQYKGKVSTIPSAPYIVEMDICSLSLSANMSPNHNNLATIPFLTPSRIYQPCFGSFSLMMH